MTACVQEKTGECRVSDNFWGCCPVLVKRQLGGRIRGLIELKFCGSVYNAWDYNLGRFTQEVCFTLSINFL
ncbi:hypothetical protein ACOSQ3_025462 [Xanthoceras sorbifolium]